MVTVAAILIALVQAAPAPPPLLAPTDPVEIGQETKCPPETRKSLEAELAFLTRAETAFLFSHRSTTEVKQRIRAVERRLADLDEGTSEPPDVESRIRELEAKRRFLLRAEAAFLHSHRSTAEVKKRIRAVDECLRELRWRPRSSSISTPCRARRAPRSSSW